MSFRKYVLFPKMKAMFRWLPIRLKTMYYHCVLKSNWKGNGMVTFLEQLFSIKADLQDAKRLPNSGKVNSFK